MAKLYKASFYCKPRKTGRYLNIRLVEKRNVLTLCEVEVYSESRGGVHSGSRGEGDIYIYIYIYIYKYKLRGYVPLSRVWFSNIFVWERAGIEIRESWSKIVYHFQEN